VVTGYHLLVACKQIEKNYDTKKTYILVFRTIRSKISVFQPDRFLAAFPLSIVSNFNFFSVLGALILAQSKK
jgi:hypothetical protein